MNQSTTHSDVAEPPRTCSYIKVSGPCAKLATYRYYIPYPRAHRDAVTHLCDFHYGVLMGLLSQYPMSHWEGEYG